MSNTANTILESQDAPNHILYSLQYFIHFVSVKLALRAEEDMN
jgi:hypothetical protein